MNDWNYQADMARWQLHPVLRACFDTLPQVGSHFPAERQVLWFRMFSAAADYVYGPAGGINIEVATASLEPAQTGALCVDCGLPPVPPEAPSDAETVIDNAPPPVPVAQ